MQTSEHHTLELDKCIISLTADEISQLINNGIYAQSNLFTIAFVETHVVWEYIRRYPLCGMDPRH